MCLKILDIASKVKYVKAITIRLLIPIKNEGLYVPEDWEVWMSAKTDDPCMYKTASLNPITRKYGAL